MDEQMNRSDESQSPKTEVTLTRWGSMRKRYLKEHRPVLYNELLLSGTLTAHLIEIDETARSRMEELTSTFAQRAGVTENLKAHDQMRWVGLMNTCRAQAEEIVIDELICN